MSTETVTIRCAGLRAALACAAKNDVRGYLNGVFLRATPQGTRLEATNGHLALFVWGHVEAHAADGLILDRGDLEAVVKLAKRAETVELEITRHPDGVASVRAMLPALIRAVGVLAGRFPDTAPLLAGELKPVSSVGVSGPYLGLLGDVATALAEKSCRNAAVLDGQTKGDAPGTHSTARSGRLGIS